MAARSIVTYPDPVLRTEAKNVSRIDKSTRQLVQDMVSTMREAKGLGLAANQIGVLQKVLVYDDGTGLRVVINPAVVKASGEQTAVEACLSVPGVQGDVKRSNEIVVKGIGADGKRVKIKAEGMAARIIQHEMDHLNGTLFIDRADPDTIQHVGEDEQEVPKE